MIARMMQEDFDLQEAQRLAATGGEGGFGEPNSGFGMSPGSNLPEGVRRGDSIYEE